MTIIISNIYIVFTYYHAAAEAPAPAEAPAAEPAKEPKAKKEKKPKPEKGAGDGGEEEKPVDVSRFDMRIGKIVEVFNGLLLIRKYSLYSAFTQTQCKSCLWSL